MHEGKEREKREGGQEQRETSIWDPILALSLSLI